MISVAPGSLQELLPQVDNITGPDDVVLLGGSTVAGLSQGSSDYDIYLIQTDDGDLWSEVPTLVSPPGAGTALEVERFTVRSVREQAARLKAMGEGDDQSLRVQLPQEMLVRYSALVTSMPLRDRAGLWPGLLADLNAEVYRLVVGRWHRSWSGELMRLAHFLAFIGALEAADARARASCAHAFDAAIVGSGELYFSPKYRFEKAARHAGHASLTDSVWRLSAPVPRLSRALVDERILAAEAFLVAAGGQRPDPEDVRIPMHHRDARLRTVGSDVLIAMGTRCWPVDARAADIWRSLSTSTRWRELRRLHPDVSAPELRATLRRFCSEGLLDLPPKLGRWAMWV
jgi:hypothetical protein